MGKANIVQEFVMIYFSAKIIENALSAINHFMIVEKEIINVLHIDFLETEQDIRRYAHIVERFFIGNVQLILEAIFIVLKNAKTQIQTYQIIADSIGTMTNLFIGCFIVDGLEKN